MTHLKNLKKVLIPEEWIYCIYRLVFGWIFFCFGGGGGLQPLPPKQNGVGHGLPAVHQLSRFQTTQDAFGGGASRVGKKIFLRPSKMQPINRCVKKTNLVVSTICKWVLV